MTNCVFTRWANCASDDQSHGKVARDVIVKVIFGLGNLTLLSDFVLFFINVPSNLILTGCYLRSLLCLVNLFAAV